MRKRFSLLSVLAEAALVSCGVLAAVCSIPTSYEAPFNLLPLAVVTALFALGVTAALKAAHEKWAIPVVLALLGVALYGIVARETIRTGAKIAWYSAVRLLSLSFSFLPTPTEPAKVPFPASCVTGFLILAAGLLVVLTAVLLVKCKSPIPALIVPIPAFVVCFIYTDCPPALYVIALLVIYWVGVLFGRTIIDSGLPKAGAFKSLFLILLAGLALLVPVLSPREGYVPIPYSERKGFIDTFGSISDRFFSHKLNNPREYDLSGEGMREEDASKAFSVNCSITGVFSLRTHSYGRYKGNVWKAAPEYSDKWISLEALGSTQGGEYASLFVRDAYTSERITPYGFVHDDEVTVGESFIRANGRTAYTWTFIPRAEFTPARTSAYEERYYRFAREQYTMPDGPMKENMLELYNELRFNSAVSSSLWQYGDAPIIPDKIIVYTGDPQDPYRLALSVASLVRQSGSYTLSPGKYQDCGDFVKRFLEGNRAGYCVHFASATTAILQALGVPARYVIGYKVEITQADTWTDVPMKAAHAWTEVYIKGVGWVPIESSAGFPDDTGYTQSGPQATAAPDQETQRPEYTLPPFDFTFAPEETARPTPEPTPRATRRPGDTPAPGPGGKSGGSGKWPLLIPAALLGALIVWEAIGAIIRKRRKRRFGQEDSRAAVLEMLRYFASIRKYGAFEPEDPEKLANEAAYSNHPMKEEQKQLLKLVRKNRATVCFHKPLKRFVLKWLLFRI